MGQIARAVLSDQHGVDPRSFQRSLGQQCFGLEPIHADGDEAIGHASILTRTYTPLMHRTLAAILMALVVSPAFGKSLHWRALDVTARLDADGRLHVIERHVMVFDGDWNGGQRRFDIRPGQELEFHGVRKLVNVTEGPLRRGNLSEVDHWDFAGNNTV